MSGPHLKSLAERIERLMDERDGIQSDIRDIYAEAKSHGFVPKVLRKAITRKRMDASKRDEEDAILELYEGALSGPMRKAVAMAARNATAREIEAETGIDQATVARSVSLNKKSETGSATVVATGEKDCGPGVPDNRIAVSNGLAGMPQSRTPHSPPQPDACTTDAATTQDAAGRTEPPAFDPDRDMPAHLRRRGEGNGVPSAARPDRGCSEAGEGTR